MVDTYLTSFCNFQFFLFFIFRYIYILCRKKNLQIAKSHQILALGLRIKICRPYKTSQNFNFHIICKHCAKNAHPVAQ